MDIPSQLFKETKLYQIPEMKLEGQMLYDAFPLESNKVAVCFSSIQKEMEVSEKELLSKILGAVKVDVSKTALINKNFTSDFSFKKMDEKFAVKRVLVFGSEFIAFFANAQIQKNKVFFLGELEILIADDLKTLLTNDAEKKALWAGMKELFV